MKTKSLVAFALLMTFVTSTFAKQERECRYYSADGEVKLSLDLLSRKGVEIASDLDSADIVINLSFYTTRNCQGSFCIRDAIGMSEGLVKLNGKFKQVTLEKTKSSIVIISDTEPDPIPQMKKAFKSAFKKVTTHKCYDELEIDQSGREVSGDKSSSSKSSSKKSKASAQ